MLTNPIQIALSSLINQHESPKGQSLYNLLNQITFSQKDESHYTLLIYQENNIDLHDDGSDDPDCSEELISMQDALISDILSLNINNLLGNPPTKLFTIAHSQAGQVFWVNKLGDSIHIQATDGNIYITIIESGQY